MVLFLQSYHWIWCVCSFGTWAYKYLLRRTWRLSTNTINISIVDKVIWAGKTDNHLMETSQYYSVDVVRFLNHIDSYAGTCSSTVSCFGTRQDDIIETTLLKTTQDSPRQFNFIHENRATTLAPSCIGTCPSSV